MFRKDTPNRYNIKYGQQISTHESVRRLMDSKRTQNTTPDRIEHCLRTFVKPEEIKKRTADDVRSSIIFTPGETINISPPHIQSQVRNVIRMRNS